MRYFAIVFLFLIASCTDYKDFTINPDDCYQIEITSNGNSLKLLRDTAWICQHNNKNFVADKAKTEALLNTLRDLRVQGISNYNPQDSFPIEIVAKNKNGKNIKTLKIKPVESTPSMIISRDGGECCVVAVPGLDINPKSNFNSSPNYWKINTLIEIVPQNVKQITIENFVNPLQSFTISCNADSFVCKNGENRFISQKNIINYISSLGSYSAKDFLDNINLDEKNKIYKILYVEKKLDTTEVTFYKKFLPDGSPDFNLMYFKTPNNNYGTIKYFDVEQLLLNAEDL